MQSKIVLLPFLLVVVALISSFATAEPSELLTRSGVLVSPHHRRSNVTKERVVNHRGHGHKQRTVNHGGHGHKQRTVNHGGHGHGHRHGWWRRRATSSMIKSERRNAETISDSAQLSKRAGSGSARIVRLRRSTGPLPGDEQSGQPALAEGATTSPPIVAAEPPAPANAPEAKAEVDPSQPPVKSNTSEVPRLRAEDTSEGFGGEHGGGYGAHEGSGGYGYGYGYGHREYRL